MVGFLALFCYLLAGIYIVRVVLHDKSPLLRIWLGTSLGFALFMWLPILPAFFVRFTLLAQGIGFALMILLVIITRLYERKHPHTPARMQPKDRGMAYALALFVLPMTLFMLYLQHTHTFQEIDGALYVGQSTYGDLMMHMSITTSLRNAAIPSEYSMLPGAVLGYPMLMDAMSTSLYMLGMSLRLSYIIPGTLMSALVFAGAMLLAREMTGSTRAALLSAILLFFNGGLGFLYDFDMAGMDTSRIAEIFTGFYKTPPNQPDLNLRWSNIVVDMLLPQRTFLAGWVLLLPALYAAREAYQQSSKRMFYVAAAFGAMLPLVNTHSFVALALYSGGALLYTLIAHPAKRRATLIGTGIYVGIVSLLALPQLMAFTFRQTAQEGFLRLHFNWVNNTGRGLIDFYPWFWLKNIGLPLIVMVCAALDFRRRNRMDLLGASLIFIVAEIILFQPLEYDNNKFFYVWYLLMLPMASAWCVSLYDRMRGMRARVLIAGLFIVVSTLSGALSMGREAVSSFQIFSADEVHAAEYIEESTPTDSIFATGQRHENLVYALTGRRVVCGPSNFLWTHGHYDAFLEREARTRAFYASPRDNIAFLSDYDVSYILLSPREWHDMYPDEDALDAMFECIYEFGNTKIYAVPEVLDADAMQSHG